MQENFNTSLSPALSLMFVVVIVVGSAGRCKQSRLSYRFGLCHIQLTCPLLSKLQTPAVQDKYHRTDNNKRQRVTLTNMFYYLFLLLGYSALTQSSNAQILCPNFYSQLVGFLYFVQVIITR